MSQSLFLRDRSFYKRSINPIEQYIEQNSFYLQRMSGRPIERCKSFIVKSLREKRYQGVSDPIVDFYERNDYGDREVFALPLTQYLKDVTNKRQILVPTFTTYKHPDEEVSIISEFTEGNVNRRSVVKKEGQLAESRGDLNLATEKENEQANMKTYNNAMSGVLGSEGSFLQNETGHNTLTSITRTMTSIGNALNECMISGNRHYRNHDVALDNVIYRAQSCDRDEIILCMAQFGLKYPTLEDCMNVISRGLHFYANDRRSLREIEEFVEKLDSVERASIVYTQDLYHLRELNPNFVRTLLTEMAYRGGSDTVDDALGYLGKVNHGILNFAHQILIDKLAGKSKDYKEIEEPILQDIARVARNIEKTVKKYSPLINAFFLTKAPPSGTAYIAGMVRRTVGLSDTDSTMFSIDEWVMWYFGKLTFRPEAYGIAGAVMFFATESIAHCLAIFSANMGVADKHLFTLQMKPEFVFPVFAQTTVAKHYFTFKLVKEGMVYAVPEAENKGVHLKSSAVSANLMKQSHEKMLEILYKVMNEELIDLHSEVKQVADLERHIEKSLLSADLEYYKRSKVKQTNAYTQDPLRSPFQHHTFWQMVFEKTYTSITPPPYNVIKIPTNLITPTATKNWIESIETPAVKEGFIAWMIKHNKKKVPTFYLCADYVKAYGIPKEIIPIINVKKILMELTGTRRMVLESCGFSSKTSWLLTEMGY